MKKRDKSRYIVINETDAVMQFFPNQLGVTGQFCYIGKARQLETYTRKEASSLIKEQNKARKFLGFRENYFRVIKLY